MRFPGFEEEWVIRSIGDFSSCYAGATPSTKNREFWENGQIPWLSSGEVNKKRISFTDTFITESGYNHCSTKMVPENTVVMALAGQGKTRGTVAITEIELCTNQSLAAIVTDGTIDNNYLLYYLETQYNNLRAISSGDGTRGGLNLQIINAFKVSLPSLAEQKKIASFFQILENRIEKQRRLVELLKSYKRGLLRLLLKQKYRFRPHIETVYSDWVEKTISEVAVCHDNKRIPITSSERQAGSYPYYGANGIQDYVTNYIFDGEYVLLAEDGGHFNDYSCEPIAQYVSGRIWVNNHAHVLEAKCNAKFLYYALVHTDIRSFINNPSRGKLNQEDMLKIKFLLPCEAEQNRISNCLSILDQRILNEESVLHSIQRTKNCLLMNLFI